MPLKKCFSRYDRIFWHHSNRHRRRMPLIIPFPNTEKSRGIVQVAFTEGNYGVSLLKSAADFSKTGWLGWQLQRLLEPGRCGITQPASDISNIKGTVSRDFRLLVFFHESVSAKPLSITIGPKVSAA
jgi:hypothetical protein